MAYRELFVVEIREVLRLWLGGDGYRRVAERAGVDRKTARRYVEHAQTLGLERAEGAVIPDELVEALSAAVRPGGDGTTGAPWDVCRTHREQIARWHAEGCGGPKLARLLHRHTGKVVPLRTMQRFVAKEVRASASRASTVRVADPEPGQVLEIDFATLGRFRDLGSGRSLPLHALICTASRSRHTFVWPCLSQTQADVIAGLEAAWAFFGGVFRVVTPDNLKAVVERPDALRPRLALGFVEYAQSRGFVVDPARVRRPQDKARVERSVRFVRDDFFCGERFGSIEEAREAARRWCLEVAGERPHGTTRRKPREHFEREEQAALLPPPTAPWDTPVWTTATVGRDHIALVEHALYSVPYDKHTVGQQLRVRADRATVRLYQGNLLVKVHPRVEPGRHSIDPKDLPPGTAELARRDDAALVAKAEALGPSVERYARRIQEDPRPRLRARQLHRLLRLGSTYGAALLDEACAQALALDVVDVVRIERMLERGLPGRHLPVSAPERRAASVVPPRFARARTTWDPARTRKPGEPDAPP